MPDATRLRSRSQLLPSHAEQARARCTARNEAGVPDEEAPCCGWYDSSHELHCGLSIIEHGDNDPGAIELAVALLLQ